MNDAVLRTSHLERVTMGPPPKCHLDYLGTHGRWAFAEFEDVYQMEADSNQRSSLNSAS
ncbi:MAG: hypothetical protein PSX80_12925 [bacterium]|nr:hypothetical protein [bacterium]